MAFTVDHSQAGSFEILPVGEYEVVISETKVDQSSEKKTPYLGLTLTIRDEADINPVGRKRKIFHNIYDTPKTQGQFQDFFKAILLDNGLVMDTLADVARAVKGSTVRVKIKHEVYNDESRARVAYFMQSQKPLSRAVLTGDESLANGGISIGDDDLPF